MVQQISHVLFIIIVSGGRFGRDANPYRLQLQLFGRFRLPLPTGQLISRFHSRPIISSQYCATCNKGVRLLSFLKLWPIIETSVISENDGIEEQKVAHTI